MLLDAILANTILTTGAGTLRSEWQNLLLTQNQKIHIVLAYSCLIQNDMRRDLSAIAAILQLVADNEANELPSVFTVKNKPENVLEEHVVEMVSQLVPFLEINGFLRKIAEQPDFRNLECYHITWKGLCFLDLFDLAESSTEPLIKANALVVLTAFH